MTLNELHVSSEKALSVLKKTGRKKMCHCKNLLFLLFDTHYRFELSHLFSCSYVTALREFPHLLFSATQFFTNYANRLFLLALKLLHSLVDGRQCRPLIQEIELFVIVI